MVNQSFPFGAKATESSTSDYVFGVFETNGWHSLAAVVLGLIGFYFTIRSEKARSVALGIGVMHVGIVGALTIWEPSTFWLASNHADQLVHASSAVGGIVTGLLTPRTSSVGQGR